MANKRRNQKTVEVVTEAKKIKRVRWSDLVELKGLVDEIDSELALAIGRIDALEKFRAMAPQPASVTPGMVSLPMPAPSPRWDAPIPSVPSPPLKAKFPIVVTPFASVGEIELWGEKERLLAALSHDCVQASGDGVESFLQLSKHGQALLVYGAVTSGRSSGGTED